MHSHTCVYYINIVNINVFMTVLNGPLNYVCTVYEVPIYMVQGGPQWREHSK